MKLKTLINYLTTMPSWSPEDSEIEVEIIVGRKCIHIPITDVAPRTDEEGNTKIVLVMQ